MVLFMLSAGTEFFLFGSTRAHAAEAAPTPRKDPPVTQPDDMDPVTKFLMDDALAQGRITQQKYAALMRDYEEQAYLRQPSWKFWYDRGFNLGSNDNAFLLRMRGRIAVQYAGRHRNSAWRDPGDAKNYPDIVGVFGDYRINRSEQDVRTINLRRARLYFMGHVFSPDLKYYIQLRADSVENNQTPGGIQLYDYFVTSTHIDWARAQIGQYKVYFNRAQINSTASMQFTERALVSDAFTASGLDRRDIGLTIMNDEEKYPLNYYFGVFGGAGPNFTRLGNFESEQVTQDCPGGQSGIVPLPPGSITCTDQAGVPPGNPLQRNLNANTRSGVDKLMFSARLNWNVMGRPGYGEGDIAYSTTPQFAVGGGFSYNPYVNTSTNNAFIGTDLANLNIRRMIAAGGNARQLGWGVVDYSTWAVDSVFKYRGFSLTGEFYYKNVIRREKGKPCVQFAQIDPSNNQPDSTQPWSCQSLDLNGGPLAPGELGNALGWYVQSGYYLVPRYLELAARYAYWDPDTHSGGDLIKQADVSLNWFLRGTYDHSIQITYTNLAMGTGGYAIGRSNPMPAYTPGPTYPNGPIPVDGIGGTLIENTIRIQYQLFF